MPFLEDARMKSVQKLSCAADLGSLKQIIQREAERTGYYLAETKANQGERYPAQIQLH